MEKKVFREADLFGSNENLRELPPVHDTMKSYDYYVKSLDKLTDKLYNSENKNKTE